MPRVRRAVKKETEVLVEGRFEAILDFRNDGKSRQLTGIILKAKNSAGEQIIEDLVDGRIKGLEYCEEQCIMPRAGGGDIYMLAIYRPNR